MNRKRRIRVNVFIFTSYLIANVVPIIPTVIDFFDFMSYILFDRYVKPYHLLVSPPFNVPVGISYGPPLTDPFNFI